MGSHPRNFTLTVPGPVRLYSTAEMLALPEPTWLIDTIMPAGGLVGLYGPPGVGKSFVAVDLAMSVASGRSWQGHPVTQGYVLYVSAEGGSGMGKRIAAWLQVRGVKPADAYAAWVTEPVFINLESDGMAALMDRIINELNAIPSLIVLDTLARCFDGDENQQEDMGRFIAGVDRLRKEFDATVIIVHHTRLDGERERGNTAFRGAADTMLSLALKKGKLVLACNKQKDAEDFEDVELELKPVPSVKSCIVMPKGYTIKAQVTGGAEELLRRLAEHGPLSWDDWLGIMEPLPRATFQRRVVILRDNGKIIKENGLWAAISKPDDDKE